LSEFTAVKKLKALGLTETEARLYIALLRGSSDAKRLSQKTGVPYSKIHTVLSKLIRKSLVMERAGRPATYEARGAAEGLAEYRRSTVEELDANLKSAKATLLDTVAEGESEKSDIWIIKNQEDILRKAYQSLNSAKNEVKVALPLAPDWAIPVLVPIVTRLRSEEVTLKLLLSHDLQEGKLGKLTALAEIRFRDKMFGGGIIVDDREALLFIGSDGSSINMAIWSNNVGLVHVARTYFDYLWGSAGESPES
jgi:sugar-specific transcriptional regulator TrmB